MMMTSDAKRLYGHRFAAWAPGPFSLSLSHLRWLATVLPAVGVFIYETLRHQIFEPHAHTGEAPEAVSLTGNLMTAMVALLLSYVFARILFEYVERIQSKAVEETRAAAAMTSMIEERERLSRELHDGLAQVMAYVLVRLDTVRTLVEKSDSEHAVAELESLRSAVDDINIDVRESIAGLRSRVVERGLVEALRDYLDEYEERYGITTEFRLDGGEPALSPDAALQFFRISQEALTNSRKHAGATHARVGVRRAGGAIELTVADDGRGFDTENTTPGGRRFGLVSMRERTESLGGTCEVRSSPLKGTVVTVTVPMARVTQ